MKGIDRGAEIVIKKWVKLKPWEKLLIVTSEETIEEAQALKKFALRRSASVDLMIVEKTGMKIGVFFDQHEDIWQIIMSL